jgi:hypothetical protein
MDAVPNEVLVIGSRFKTELTGWVDSGPGCLRQVRDSVNGNGSQSSSCIPLQFRLVSSGPTTPTAEKRRYPLQVQQSTEDDVDMHAERRGAFFTEHPLLAVSRPPTASDAAKGAVVPLGHSYYKCPGDGVNGCGVPRSSHHECMGNVAVVVSARAKARFFKFHLAHVHMFKSFTILICSS